MMVVIAGWWNFVSIITGWKRSTRIPETEKIEEEISTQIIEKNVDNKNDEGKENDKTEEAQL